MFPHSRSSGKYHQMLHFPVPTPIFPMDPSRWKPNNNQPAPNCPRCSSSNTKFCYYNNYSFSQPRYFCKACRRYWTKGGFLRNVPIGGGSRKTRRSKIPRHSLTDRLSTGSFSANSGSEDRESVANKDNEANGSDIDMALVFAKFLSSDQDFNDQANGSSSFNSSDSLTPESVETEKDAPHPSDPITDSSEVLLGGLPQEEKGLMSGIELEWEGLLGGDEVVQDVFWSDATSTSSSLTWEPPMMQLQEELEYSIPLNDEDAELPISSTMNLVSDGWSWSSFDFSTLQVFSSRP